MEATLSLTLCAYPIFKQALEILRAPKTHLEAHESLRGNNIDFLLTFVLHFTLLYLIYMEYHSLQTMVLSTISPSFMSTIRFTFVNRRDATYKPCTGAKHRTHCKHIVSFYVRF